jgi:hypothetical protein
LKVGKEDHGTFWIERRIAHVFFSILATA